MKPVLELADITVERQNRTILSHIYWRIESGEQWVLMGLNGSGKTSLLTLIAGYEWPSHGQVSVLGQRYGTVDLREMRKRIGWVSHHLSEWMSRDHGHVAVKDVVQSGRLAVVGRGPATPAATARAAQVLAKFELEQLADNRFASLSQGEKTRVLLARAWMADVSLLILDEPCSGLDIAAREQLLRFVNQYLTDADSFVSVIYVTHHPEEILPGFTHALLLQDGRVLAQGRVAEMLTPALLSEAFRVSLDVQMVGGRHWVQVLPEGPNILS